MGRRRWRAVVQTVEPNVAGPWSVEERGEGVGGGEEGEGGVGGGAGEHAGEGEEVARVRGEGEGKDGHVRLGRVGCIGAHDGGLEIDSKQAGESRRGGQFAGRMRLLACVSWL